MQGRALKVGLATVLTTSLILLAGCSTSNEEDKEVPNRGEVVVNNGEEDTSTKESSDKDTDDVEIEESKDTEESTDTEEPSKRKVVSEDVPKTTRETLDWDKGDYTQEDTQVDENNPSMTKPDFSRAYLRVNDGKPETTDFNVPYTLYYKDDNGRSIGGEAVVTKGTLDIKPSVNADSVEQLYPTRLLSTNLVFDERGLEDRNEVLLTSQASMLLNKLFVNIYNAVESNEEDNHVYISLEALYDGDNQIPFGIHIQAQSVHGDIKFNYIVNNKQQGYTVNYKDGTVEKGSTVSEERADDETKPRY